MSYLPPGQNKKTLDLLITNNLFFIFYILYFPLFFSPSSLLNLYHTFFFKKKTLFRQPTFPVSRGNFFNSAIRIRSAADTKEEEEEGGGKEGYKVEKWPGRDGNYGGGGGDGGWHRY